jgi:hypothetical protein
MARAERIAPPALLIVGDVVRLRAKLAWFGGTARESSAAAGQLAR